MDDSREARAAGCLLGLACGDALGAPFEGGPPLDEPPMDFQPGRFGPPGSWTDDTQLALATAECILEKGGLDPDGLVRRFASMLDDIRGIGTTTRLALEAVRSGASWKEAARKAHETAGGRSAGNGAVMRAAPVALRFWNDPLRLRQASVLQAAVIHYDTLAHEAAWLFNRVLAALVRGVSEPSEAMGEVEVEFLSDERRRGMAALLREAVTARRRDLPPPDGFVLNTLTNALWCFLSTDRFEDAVRTAVSLGGDTDTTAAVTGALAGAFYGEDAVPERWLAALERADRIREAALGLYRASLEGPACTG